MEPYKKAPAGLTGALRLQEEYTNVPMSH